MVKKKLSFFQEVINSLKKQNNRLDGRTLKRFIGGQVKIFYPTTKDCLLGNINDIILESGCLQVSCKWIAHKQRRGRVWNFDKKRSEIGLLNVRLKPGWEKDWDTTDSGYLLISGVEGNMLLTPEDSEFASESEIVNLFC